MGIPTKDMIRKKQNTKIKVDKDSTLLTFLQEKFPEKSRSNLKSILSHRLLFVNGAIQTRHDTPLQAGDMVEISTARGNVELRHPKLRMLYEDAHLIVVEKKCGLLTVATHQDSRETTVFSILKNYVKKSNQRANIYTVHRLDRETSGVLVFAKTQQLQEYMRTYWHQLVTRRVYFAVVHGDLKDRQGTIVSWLTEDNNRALVYASSVDDGGKKAVTHYKVLGYNSELDCSSLELSLETGRTNQIRVQLASKGYPVIGDRKYGNGNQHSPVDRLCLHARLIEFIHPVLEQKVSFEVPIPKEFRQFK